MATTKHMLRNMADMITINQSETGIMIKFIGTIQNTEHVHYNAVLCFSFYPCYDFVDYFALSVFLLQLSVVVGGIGWVSASNHQWHDF